MHCQKPSIKLQCSISSPRPHSASLHCKISTPGAEKPGDSSSFVLFLYANVSNLRSGKSPTCQAAHPSPGNCPHSLRWYGKGWSPSGGVSIGAIPLRCIVPAAQRPTQTVTLEKCVSSGRCLPVYIWRVRQASEGCLLFRRTSQTRLVQCRASQHPYQVADADFYILRGSNALPGTARRDKGRCEEHPA
jgi:hypothetical protein